MTEAEWLTPSDDAITICRKLDFLMGKASERKFNLFRFACCRQIWHLLLHDLYRQAVEAAERLIEGQSTREELNSVIQSAENMVSAVQASSSRSPRRILEIRAATVAIHAARADYEWLSFPDTASYACCIVQEATSAACWATATDACWHSEASTPSPEWPDVYQQVQQATLRLHGMALLDVFGNPFCSVALDPTWLTPSVFKLAQTIYEERAFDRLLNVAEVLQEAGCNNEEILSHCREPGPHVRGCWVVDLLLNKE